MSNNMSEKERWALAAKLESILGAGLEPDEEDAIWDAINIICPGYVEELDRQAEEVADWFDSKTPEEIAQFVKDADAELAKSKPNNVTDINDLRKKKST